MSKINMTDKYQTKDGREVRILCVDLDNHMPVVAVISHKDGHEYICQFTEEGYYWASKIPTETDLIPVPKEEYWINVYPNWWSSRLDTGKAHESKEMADKEAGPNRIACIKFKEGEGL